MKPPPLNGSKTHPLSEHALGALRLLAMSPQATQALNPGVVNRLQREDPPVVEEVQMRSPYATHKGAAIPHLRITDAGRRVIGR